MFDKPPMNENRKHKHKKKIPSPAIHLITGIYKQTAVVLKKMEI